MKDVERASLVQRRIRLSYATIGYTSFEAIASTSLCAYLSIIALAGVLLNATFGWWWADPLAALGMVPIMVSEGIDGLRAKPCEDCA